MPPQPLSFVKRSAVVKLGTEEAFQRHPKLGALVARAIAAWAHAETIMGDILIQMLGARAEPAAKMYAALNNTQAQFDALTAAARCSLKPRNLEMFEAIISLTRQTSRARHRLAHDLWCYSDDLPDALLLFEADAAFQYKIERYAPLSPQRTLAAALEPKSRPELPKDRIFIYRQQELSEIVGQILELQMFLCLFVIVVMPDSPSADANYNELLLEPRIQEALDRLRKQSGTAP